MLQAGSFCRSLPQAARSVVTAGFTAPVSGRRQLAVNLWTCASSLAPKLGNTSHVINRRARMEIQDPHSAVIAANGAADAAADEGDEAGPLLRLLPLPRASMPLSSPPGDEAPPPPAAAGEAGPLLLLPPPEPPSSASSSSSSPSSPALLRPSQLPPALDALAGAVKASAPSGQGGLISLPLFHTVSNLAMLQALTERVEQLGAGAYEGVIGSACRTLVGDRRIGKTNMLLAFTAACKAAFPSIIPPYVTGMGFQDGRNSFAKVGLQDLMIATARYHGVEVDETVGADALTAGLEKAGQRMLIMVDHIDELYTVEPGHPAEENITASLQHLQLLGNQSSGRYAVLLCGGSTFTHRLICKS